MATNEPGKLGRQLALQVTHFLRKRIAASDAGLTGEVGILPAGAIILRASVYVSTAFNTGTLNVGLQGGDADEFASALALNAQAIVAFDELAVTNQVRASESVITYARSAVQSAGVADIVVEYVVNNDQD